MQIRSYRAGDETAQVEIYNEAAASLPKFKPATVEDVSRRIKEPDFDPATRLYAEEGGRIVGYATFHPSGRVSYPWCRKGHEQAADPLAEKVLQTMSERGLKTAFAAYRTDWPAPLAFFEKRGFHKTREMINYVLQLSDMPTRSPRPTVVTLLRREDVPAIFAMMPGALRVASAAELEKHMFQNPYYSSASYYVVRNKTDGSPAAVGFLILNPEYADPYAVDANMPCFRLGAFGTEGLTHKRINGMFSFLTPNTGEAMLHATQLLEYAAASLEDKDLDSLAAQVASDVPHLARFYKQTFLRQGGFPVYEKTLG